MCVWGEAGQRERVHENINMSDAAASATADEVARDDATHPEEREAQGQGRGRDERHGDETASRPSRVQAHPARKCNALIASAEQQAPMRDARGRRKSVCVGALRSGGRLSALVGGSAAIASSSNEGALIRLVQQAVPPLAQNIENDQQDEQGDLQHASGKSLCKADESSPRDVGGHALVSAHILSFL